jgi:chromosome segregation ATPase
MKCFLLLLLLFFVGCAHSSVSPAQEDAQISQFSKPEAESRLTETQQELNEVAEKQRTAEALLGRYEFAAMENSARQDAVEGTRAEIEALQSKRAALIHRQHSLEARLRELSWSSGSR